MLENGRYSNEKAMETLCECLTQTGATFSVYLAMAKLAPREMRRAWMTAFGNAKLDGRFTLEERDLPDGGPRRSPIGFVQ
jgi:hypothetical protein